MKRKLTILFLVLIVLVSFYITTTKEAHADELSDSISEQLENIDLSELEDYYNSLQTSDNGGVISFVEKLLKGEYDYDYNSLYDYIFSTALNEFKAYIPLIIALISLIILSGIIYNLRPDSKTNSSADIVFLICILGVILLISGHMISSYNNIKNTIDNIAKLTEIMSPIILTLMLAVGGNVSASVYSPSVVFLSNGVINVVNNVVLPLIIFVLFFSVLSNFTPSVRLNKFVELGTSLIKWIIGIIITIYTLFLSVQGITSATFDGISVKATKYAISNSIPLVGGFIRDGFDLVVAGSVLIKNSIGIVTVFALFYTVLSPVLSTLIFSLCLRFVSAISETISDQRISNVCTAMSKCLSYLISCLLLIGFMLFITVLLMIFSANAFV